MVATNSTFEIYEQLRRMILDHTVAPSTRVNIHQIARSFGVSQTPVREALRLLQGDNLLVAISNKGYATTPVLDAAGVRALFELRLLVEPWAARIAASNRLSNPAAQLKAEIDGFQIGNDSVQYAMISHDSRFHGAILKSTENPIVIQAFEQAHCHLHLFRMIRSDWNWQASLEQHRLIKQAIAAQDPDAAEQAMRKHLHSAFQGFMKSMDASGSAELTFENFAPANLVIG